MAASQMECLEDSEARPWPSGSNPRHVYSEGQRRALEALLEEGDASYWSCLQREGIRPFLSAGEASRFQRRALARGPGTPEPAGPQPAPEDEGRPVPSLTYWPLHTDDGAPCLALGWPEGGMWKGITRGTVYTHPPAEGAPTIKEVVRNLLQSAKQVIAVVMDLFTDIDVFVDIVEAASARRVPAYILVGERSLPQFIAMARGYPTDLRLLENVQVRGLSGCTFCSRNGKKVTGDVKERFLLVDGETVITGSYSHTTRKQTLRPNQSVLTLIPQTRPVPHPPAPGPVPLQTLSLPMSLHML